MIRRSRPTAVFYLAVLVALGFTTGFALRRPPAPVAEVSGEGYSRAESTAPGYDGETTFNAVCGISLRRLIDEAKSKRPDEGPFLDDIAARLSRLELERVLGLGDRVSYWGRAGKLHRRITFNCDQVGSGAWSAEL